MSEANERLNLSEVPPFRDRCRSIAKAAIRSPLQGSLPEHREGSNPIPPFRDRCQRQSDLSSTLTLSPIYPPLTPPGRGTVQVIASEAYRSRQSLLPPLPLSLLLSFLPFPVPRIGYKRQSYNSKNCNIDKYRNRHRIACRIGMQS